jgi:V/A-type H+/Na+-transporting ATPase subunit D
MPDAQGQPPVTRIAQLELKDERRLVKEGYELLDEKRIRLVAEIRAQLERLRLWESRVSTAEASACAALKAAVAVHGLEELAAYPPLSAGRDDLKLTRTRLFGLELILAQFQTGSAPRTMQPVHPSPEADTCARGYRALLEPLVNSAVHALNLRRLLNEFTRTERRARAIENVLLPEIDRDLKRVDEQLELIDQEELARVHRWHPAD